MAYDLLPALDGVAYVTDTRAHIQEVGCANWDRSAVEAGTPALRSEAIIGRNLLDFITGADVRAAYRRIHEAVQRGRRRITFQYRCDGPDVERRMRLSVSPIVESGQVVGLLYQSQTLSERSRPPIALLSVEEALSAMRSDGSPVLPICSFCLKTSQDRVRWVTAEEYYRNGGTSTVRLSHGVCPDCDEELDAEITLASREGLAMENLAG